MEGIGRTGIILKHGLIIYEQKDLMKKGGGLYE